EWGATRESFVAALAKEAPRGTYPRAFTGEQTWWAVVGVDGGHAKALLGEDGALETGKGGYSIEPFLFSNGRLLTWADVKTEAALPDPRAPISSVTWQGA